MDTSLKTPANAPTQMNEFGFGWAASYTAPTDLNADVEHYYGFDRYTVYRVTETASNRGGALVIVGFGGGPQPSGVDKIGSYVPSRITGTDTIRVCDLVSGATDEAGFFIEDIDSRQAVWADVAPSALVPVGRLTDSPQPLAIGNWAALLP